MSSGYESSRAAPTGPLAQFTDYPFDTDPTYQQGLASILASTQSATSDNSSPDERDELLRRIRVFYFNKATGNSLTIEEVKAHEQSLNQQSLQPEPSPSSAPAGTTTTTTLSQNIVDDPKVLSFAEIKELIEAGRLDEIPNNKTIPDSLNQETPSESIVPARKKPWEIALENQSATPEGVEA